MCHPPVVSNTGAPFELGEKARDPRCPTECPLNFPNIYIVISAPAHTVHDMSSSPPPDSCYSLTLLMTSQDLSIARLPRRPPLTALARITDRRRSRSLAPLPPRPARRHRAKDVGVGVSLYSIFSLLKRSLKNLRKGERVFSYDVLWSFFFL